MHNNATASPRRRRLVIGILVVAVIGLAVVGCAGDEDAGQPLSPITIRSRFAGRTFNGVQNGQRFLIHFDPRGIATVNAATAEFGRWTTSEQGLCLTWYAQPAVCAPVYQLGFARYRVGAMELNSQETFERGPLREEIPGFGRRPPDRGPFRPL